ncbi:MAG: hypothetical protein IJ452_04875 [Butyricicoccus sp.]|nr:hypothetical protein [Butyricicoccus sp.]MBQ8585601.1 hypothetical protein [Butyricicoccus sp.]
MKKRLTSFLLAVVMCVMSCVPALAIGNDTSRPPCVTEDEIWYPANGIMTVEEGNECGRTGHLAPSGYVYRGHSVGDSFFDSAFVSGALTLSGTIPGLGAITAIISLYFVAEGVYSYYANGGEILTTYTKYVWEKDGDYWYHIIWTKDVNGDGQKEYVTCKVETYP